MKKILSILFLWVCVFWLVWNTASASRLDDLLKALSDGTDATATGSTASTGSVIAQPAMDRFSVTMSNAAKVWENLDVTVTALAKDGSTFIGYRGTVFVIVDGDNKAKTPYAEGYTFSQSDKGVHVFPKGISFSKEGIFKVIISDLDKANITGTATVKVTGESILTNTWLTSSGVPEKITTNSGSTTSQAKAPSSTSVGQTELSTGSVIQSPAPVSASMFENIKVETSSGNRVSFTFQVTNDDVNIKKFELAYGTTDGDVKKVITYDKEKIKNSDGTYSWYVPNLDPAKKYTFTIAGVNSSGDTIPGVISAPVKVDLSLASAGEKCLISEVSDVVLRKENNESILSWKALPEAISYKVYKRNSIGKFVFIADTKNPEYRIRIASGPVKFEEFSIKAVCADKTESADFSKSTLVQTGPAELILLCMASIGIGYGIVRKRKYSNI